LDEDADAGSSSAELDAGLSTAALASIGNAVAITDASGVIRWVNPAFTQMSGYPASEAIGRTPRLLKSGMHDEAFYTQLWSTVLDGRPWTGEVVNRHRSGRLYTVVQTITPIVDPSRTVTHFVAVHEDVTELRQDQARLRALFDHALDAVVFFDDRGQVMDANPVACELAGRDLDELVSTPVAELLAGEDWGELWPQFRDGRRRTGNCRVHRGGGTFEVAVQVVANVMSGVHVAICRDVTAQRRVEAERDFQAQLVEAAGVAVIAADLERKVTFWNAAARQLYGWSRGEVLGRDIVEVTGTRDAIEHADEIMATVRSGGTWSGEFEVRRRDGTTFPALVTAAPYVDASGQLAGIIGVSTDVTELRQAQGDAQLRASQQTAVAQLGRRALTDLDLDGIFDEAVKAVAVELDVPLVSVLELTEEGDRLLLRAGVGSQDDLIGVATVPTDPGSQQAGYALEHDRAVVVDELATETRFDVPPELTHHGAVSGVSTPIRGQDRRFGVLAAHTTTRRAFSDDEITFLDAVAAVLGAAIVRDRIEAELQATVDRLARSDEIRTAFLRATSHELRTPLTALAGFAQTLEDRDTDLDPHQRRLLVGRLRANTDRLSQLITDLLDVDRLSSGLVTANRQPHDLDQLVHRVIDQQDLTGRHLDVDLDTIRAEVDPPKLERAVANLLANAVRHTPTGATIHIGLHRRADATVLVVADDGPGIDPDYLDQVFEPFVQGPEQHHTPQPGTGLGLSLVRELITLHDGTITAHNRPEGGARFEITLPDPPATPPS